MILRQEQIAVLTDAKRQAFRKRLLMRLYTSLDRCGHELPEAVVRERMDSALHLASARNIEAERDIIRYAFIIVAFGENLRRDEHTAWMADILDGPGSANQRLNQIGYVLQSSLS